MGLGISEVAVLSRQNAHPWKLETSVEAQVAALSEQNGQVQATSFVCDCSVETERAFQL